MKKLSAVVAAAAMTTGAWASVQTAVRAWGSAQWGSTQVPADLGSVASVAGARMHAAALRTDGSVVHWGFQALESPTDLSPVIQMDTGRYVNGGAPFAIALEATGRVRCFGSNFEGSCDVPSSLGPAIWVSAGSAHSAAVDRRGKVWCWGFNNCGQVDVPADLPSCVQVEAGDCHTIALQRDGTVRQWGSVPPIPALIPPVADVSAGGGFSVLISSSGQVISIGGPIPPVDLRPAIDVSAAQDHVAVIQDDGTVRSWGNNNVGQASPPSDLSAAMQISSGGEYQIILECTRNTRVLVSPELSPFSFSAPRTWIAKGVSDPRAGAVVRVTARGQLGTATRFLNVRADGVLLGTIFGANSGAGACSASTSVALLPISAAQFASMSSDGTVEFRVEPSINATSAGCETATLTVTLQYEGQIIDCDSNGVDDICQLESAPLVQDCNGNGLLDACEPFGEETDCDGNGVFDSCDIARGAADEDNDGEPDECELNYGDLNLDGQVDGKDLAALLAVWGMTDPPYGDLNGDGLIQGADISYLLARWGPVP